MGVSDPSRVVMYSDQASCQVELKKQRSAAASIGSDGVKGRNVFYVFILLKSKSISGYRGKRERERKREELNLHVELLVQEDLDTINMLFSIALLLVFRFKNLDRK